jgi:hypothetical protein
MLKDNHAHIPQAPQNLVITVDSRYAITATKEEMLVSRHERPVLCWN